MRKLTVRDEVVRGWAWEIKIGDRWELCYWLSPTRKELMADLDKPSSEARPVRVIMQRRRT